MMKFSRRSFVRSSSAAIGALAAMPAIVRATPGSADARFVYEALYELHPGLLRYQTGADFAERHARFASAFDAGDFDAKVLALQELLGAVRCGHTYVNPSNQAAEMQERLYASRRLLPFHFRWIGDDMVVTADPHGIGVQPGSSISAIDGVKASDILASVLPYARADGSNDDKRRALMSVTGTRKWPMFDLYYALVHQPGETVAIDFTSPQGTSATKRVETIDIVARRAGGKAQLPDDPSAPIWFAESVNSGRTRVMTMPTWGTYKTKWDWEGWLRGQLGDVLSGGADGLIFDLRGNEGGYNIGEGMLPSLIRDPLSVPQSAERVRFRTAPDALRPQLNTWDPTFYEIGTSGERISDRMIELAPAGEQRIEPVGSGFGGKIAVLIDADNSSATFSFAQQLRSAGLARLIGEPTGGNQRGINGGAYFFSVLPESGIEFDIPLIGYFPQGEQPDAGLTPDEIVRRTPTDIAQGRDPAMERAIAVTT